MKMLRIMLGVLLFHFAISCSHVNTYWEMTTERGVTKTYLETLKKWTRTESLYSQLETKVHLTVTRKTKSFYDIYLDEYARIYRLSEEEKKRMAEMEQGLMAQFDEYFVYAAMPNREANDFDSSKSVWGIFLLSEKEPPLKPVEVRRIEKVTPLIEQFFPYVNKYYGICYQLKFPRTIDPEKPVKLLFTSVFGEIALSWP